MRRQRQQDKADELDALGALVVSDDASAYAVAIKGQWFVMAVEKPAPMARVAVQMAEPLVQVAQPPAQVAPGSWVQTRMELDQYLRALAQAR